MKLTHLVLGLAASTTLAMPQGGGLEAGLAAINADHIRSDIYFIASDEMAGRDSPSPEQRIAARFIRSRLMRLGFDPGWKDSYFHPYTLPEYTLNQAKTGLVLDVDGRSLDLKLGTDYFLHGTSKGNRDVTGTAVWVGDLSEADPEDLDVAGQWAVGTASKGLSGRRRRGYAGEGAVGVLVLPTEGSEVSVAEAHGPYYERMIQPSMRGARDSEFAYVLLTEGTASRLAPLLAKAKPGDALPILGRETCVVEAGKTHLENVMGIWPGSDPSLRDEVIILSAHYDHVGSRDNGDIYNGADDNGSGTCGLLALAEGLAAHGPMRRTVMLQWVSAEEKGLLGSAAWTKDPWLPEGMKPVCNINIDMIGRNAPEKLHITPTKDHEEYSWLTRVAERHSPEEGFPKLGNADAYYWRSDHANYRKNLDVPVAFLFTDVHEDYHKPTDTAEKIDVDKIRRVVRLVLRMLADLQGDRLGG